MPTKTGAKVLKTAADILKYMSIFGGIGSLNPANSITDNLHGVLGSTVGYLASHGMKKASEKMMKKAKSKQGKGKKHEKIIDILHMLHKHKGPIHISDLPFKKPHIQKIIGILEHIATHHPKKGKGRKHHPFRKIKEFFQGKTKVKPSHILKGLSTALGFLSYVPGFSVLGSLGSATSGIASSVLHKKGKGLKDDMGYRHLTPVNGQVGEGMTTTPLQALTQMDTGVKMEGKGVKLAGKGIGKGVKLAGKGVKLAGKGVQLAGKGKKRKYGSRDEVWGGSCNCTRGGLYKKDLMQNGKGKIISKKQHQRGKILYNQYLKKKRMM